MQVEFLSSFNKDLSKLSSEPVRKSLKNLILKLEAAKSLSEISQLKKLRGHSDAWRIRLGNYRVGFFYNNNIIQLARVVDRKDIYKVFP
jgi:mRNA-degrading endonuclease RelE of RelBE toxin-antitoxin system